MSTRQGDFIKSLLWVVSIVLFSSCRRPYDDYLIPVFEPSINQIRFSLTASSAAQIHGVFCQGSDGMAFSSLVERRESDLSLSTESVLTYTALIPRRQQYSCGVSFFYGGTQVSISNELTFTMSEDGSLAQTRGFNSFPIIQSFNVLPYSATKE